MKKILSVLSVAAAATAVMVGLFFIKTSETGKRSTQAIEKFAMTFADGEISEFSKDKFPDDMILYFFTPQCELCFAELREIISFSKQEKVKLLFVTSDSLHNARAFAKELAFWGIDKASVSIARISPDDVARIFGEARAPQSIFFGNGLQVKGTRKGIISYEMLAESFE